MKQFIASIILTTLPFAASAEPIVGVLEKAAPQCMEQAGSYSVAIAKAFVKESYNGSGRRLLKVLPVDLDVKVTKVVTLKDGSIRVFFNYARHIEFDMSDMDEHFYVATEASVRQDTEKDGRVSCLLLNLGIVDSGI